jgi:type I restriction enzyme M protein
MNGRLIAQIIDYLRGVISQDELLPFVLQLVAWLRLSKQGKLSRNLAFNEHDLPRSAKHIADIFRQIADENAVGGQSAAFGYVNPGIQHLSAGQIVQSIEVIMHSDITEPWPTDDLITFLNEKSSKNFLGIPTEIAELMLKLAEIRTDDKVYIPFEMGFQLTACAQKITKNTYSETPYATGLPWLMNLLCDMDANIAIGESIEKPSFLDDGRLTRFPVSVAFPPMGIRYNQAISESDRFGRFPEPTTSGAVLAIRHLMARTMGRIVVAIQNNVLYSPGAERSLRDELLAEKQIEAVISLPPALLYGATIQFSLLVLRTDCFCNDILFVDASQEPFYSKDTRARATLTGWQAIVDIVKQRQSGEFSSLVTAETVEENDNTLQVSRYCKTSDDEAVTQFLSKYEVKALSDLVEIIRPIPLSADGKIEANEIAQADFPEFGYASHSSRTVKLSDANARRGKKSFLQPLDIVLVNKGAVGRVALVSPDAGENLVAGQSCVILRIIDKMQGIDPQTLFSYLRSDIGQTQLKQITAGAAVAVIQLRDLEKMAVPVPTIEQSRMIARQFEEVAAIEKDIAALRAKQQQISEAAWA